mgnify:CR=1 FL=1
MVSKAGSKTLYLATLSIVRDPSRPVVALVSGARLQVEGRLRERVDGAREDGDSLGGVFEVRAEGLPPGLGSYHSGPERLTARLGAALLSIPAMKGVEFGLGFEAALVLPPLVWIGGRMRRRQR